MDFLVRSRQNRSTAYYKPLCSVVNVDCTAARPSCSSQASDPPPSEPFPTLPRLRPLVRARDTESQTQESSEEDDCDPVPWYQPKKRKEAFELSHELSSAMDRGHLSVRVSTHLVPQTLKQEGSSSPLPSKSRLHASRTKLRNKMGNNIRKEFCPQSPVTVHFDSKIMEDVDGDAKCDRLAILITGPENEEQVLGSPKLESGSGENQALAVSEILEQWNLTEKVWMLREQFQLSKEEEAGLRNLCIFGFNTYVEYWYKGTTCAAGSARYDLELFHHLSAEAK
ncbi:hypothetical protein FOCC_FOCC014724, partial [Frankliniella occidentalis]